MLKFLVKNYPDHEDAKDWEWNMWLLERNVEDKMSLAKKLWKNEARREAMQAELEKLSKLNKDNPWVYRRSCEIMSTIVDKEKLKAATEECEDLKVLLRYQHEFPKDEYLEIINEKRSKLLALRYRAGRLAALSGQPRKAVAAFNDVLLYDSGSELEEEARGEIYRLNTLSDKSEF
jgi:hypothetical protein